MEILKEVTVWDDETLNKNNGIYWVNQARQSRSLPASRRD